MYKIKIGLFILGILLASSSRAANFPLEISEIYSSNKIVELQQQKLVLVDFWATWCGPCKPATEQLEILQQQMKDEVFIVSVTDETHETVAKYMEKSPIDLMVVRDFGGNLIRKFNVYRRPYAVILNTKGNIVWEGHPSDLTYKTVKLLANKYKSLPVIKINEVFMQKVKKIENNSNQNQSETILSVKKENSEETRFLLNYNSVIYKGSLFKLIAKIYNVPNHLVKSEKVQDFNVEFESPIEVWDTQPDTILNLLFNNFNFSIEPQTRTEDAYFMEMIDDSKLWDKTQINWGEDNISNYLIGEDRIMADNTTVADFSLLLSNTKKQIYKYFGDNFELHDWDIHFRFDELLEAELLNEFGIELQKKKLIVTYLIIE